MYPCRRCLFRVGILAIALPTFSFMIYFLFTTVTPPKNEIPLSSPINSSLFTSFVRPRPIPDIFDLALWRHILIGRRGNQTLCTVPLQYQPITDAYCRAHNRDKCPKVPCTLIYLPNEFTEHIQCLRGGKRAIGVKSDWTCRLSPALELLSDSHRKPSLRAEAYTALTSELYGQALAPFRDPEASKWGLTLQGESVAYYPSVAEKKRVLPLFDITLGYDRRFFDLITDVHLTDYVDQITNQRFTIEQVLQKKVKNRASILWINSNCNTPSNRTAYVLELMRYIRIDIRGKCGNPDWNETFLSSDPKILAKEKLALAEEYLFTIAIENSLEYDYVTEKLWQPLAAGSVPIYLGAPNIDEWLPCSNYSCIINLKEFATIRDAANLINELVENKERYLKYHQWRNEIKLRESFLQMINYFREANQYSMKCLLCDMVHRNDHGTTRRRLLAANNPFRDIFPSLV